MPELKIVEKAPNPAVVTVAEMILKEAKSGDLQGIVVAAVTEYGEVFTADAGEIRLFSLVGAIESLKLKLLLQHDEVAQEEIKRITE